MSDNHIPQGKTVERMGCLSSTVGCKCCHDMEIKMFIMTAYIIQECHFCVSWLCNYQLMEHHWSQMEHKLSCLCDILHN